ncbi:EamA family transporter [Candidatus Pelagibacter sp.]|jgi:drug/metabolite transporter (DMT)-like permease|nr:EamA family transporter [Candidatus Pelagibacter sp.]
MNWIVITIFGAFFQNLRSSIQKKLNANLSTIASTYVRFAFALPFATLLFFIYFRNFEIISIILVQSNFVYYTILASVFQIIFTFILLYLFKFSNFVVGTALSKTEVIQVAIFEYFLLKDKLNIFGVFGIIIATIGVIIISVKDLKLFFNNFFSKTTLIGLTTGLFLALSVVFFRAAALSLENFSSNFEKAISTLFFGLVIQTFIITIYLCIFERSEFKKFYDNKFESFLAGFAGFMATMSWFFAFTLIQASFVRALGQVEIFFSYLSSKYLFKEKITISEIVGILIFVSGVAIMLLTKMN